MRPAVGRLVLTAALFVGWLGYLGYLVACRPHTPGGLRGAVQGRPLTLARPQFLVSTLDVIAEVNDPQAQEVVVTDVLFPRDDAPVKPGDTIRVTNLERCRALPDPIEPDREPPPDWSGPGRYLLPLRQGAAREARTFEVAPTPASPGYPALLGDRAPRGYPRPGQPGPPRIYPALPGLLAEYRDIAKP